MVGLTNKRFLFLPFLILVDDIYKAIPSREEEKLHPQKDRDGPKEVHPAFPSNFSRLSSGADRLKARSNIASRKDSSGLKNSPDVQIAAHERWGCKELFCNKWPICSCECSNCSYSYKSLREIVISRVGKTGKVLVILVVELSLPLLKLGRLQIVEPQWGAVELP